MQTAILKTESKSDLKLILEIARKFGIKSKTLSPSEAEDIGLIAAMKHGRTRKFVDTDSYLKKLRA